MPIVLNKWLLLCLLCALNSEVWSFRCDRRPYGSTTEASAPDGRFKLMVADAEDTYIPEQVYTVQIRATDDDSRFTSFMISAEGDMKPDPRNSRRLVSQYPGEIRPASTTTARFSDRCLYSVEQAITSSKSSVEVYWQAPSSGSGCVTLRAMVAENEDDWYEDGAPLTRRMCEDMQQPDDVTPQLNYDCNVCDEAKYEISFTGIWSRNTHPVLYPENDWTPRFSDLVGASHAADFILWSPGTLATDGLKNLAEYANSTQFEVEIREKIGDGVRTLIKGKGHGYRKMRNPTYAFFRVDKVNHLVSAAVGLFPSPDWFLGVTRFDLCTEDNTWLREKELNLYPWDAGTDSGVSYESPNIKTYPQGAVSRVQMSSYNKNSPFYEVDMKDLHPFGKLRLRLIRTYHRECEEEDNETPAPDEGTNKEESSAAEPEEPSRYQNLATSGERDGEAPITSDVKSSEDCPMSQWQDWSPCEGVCENGVLHGYMWRERYHLVNGVPVEMYDPDDKSSYKTKATVSEYCKIHYEDFERAKCKEDCSEDNNLTAERRVMEPKTASGHGWATKK